MKARQASGTDLVRRDGFDFRAHRHQSGHVDSFAVHVRKPWRPCGGAGSFVDAGFVVAGVVGGSAGWWLALTTVIGLFHARIDETVMRMINRISGVLVIGFGLAVLVHLAMKFA